MKYQLQEDIATSHETEDLAGEGYDCPTPPDTDYEDGQYGD